MPADEVSALDAYQTLKPGEPGFTLQGGDPLGYPMVEAWADFARMRAGAITADACTAAFMRLVEAARDNKTENERETADLLLRATAAEEVGWNMKAYFRGQAFEATTHEEGPDEKARIDLHDYRVHAAQRLNNAVGELVEIRGNLKALGFNSDSTFRILEEAFQLLRSASEDIEPRRLFRES